MDIPLFINNFPWNRFGHGYGNSPDLKERYVKIHEGTATPEDYDYIIYRIENQATLFWVTTFCLKITFALLEKETTNKKLLLEHVATIHEAANYGRKVDLAMNYKPSKGMLEKYTQIRNRIFSEEFDGTMDSEFIKQIKSLDRNFMKIMALDFMEKHKVILENFMESKDDEVAKTAVSLMDSMNHPRKFTFDGVEY